MRPADQHILLGLWREAGLVSVGAITINGTKMHVNASMDPNRSYSRLVKDILREAEAADEREDELYGDDHGDELPAQLRTPDTRRQALEEAKRLAERKGRPADDETKPESEKLEIDLEAAVLSRPVLLRGRRIGWLRVARQELEAHRTRLGAQVQRDRDDRMIDALERLEENHRVDLAAVETYERWRSTARETKGRLLKGNSKPFVEPDLPEGTAVSSLETQTTALTHVGRLPGAGRRRQEFSSAAAANSKAALTAPAPQSRRTRSLSSPAGGDRMQIRGTACWLNRVDGRTCIQRYAIPGRPRSSDARAIAMAGSIHGRLPHDPSGGDDPHSQERTARRRTRVQRGAGGLRGSRTSSCSRRDPSGREVRRLLLRVSCQRYRRPAGVVAVAALLLRLYAAAREGVRSAVWERLPAPVQAD